MLTHVCTHCFSGNFLKCIGIAEIFLQLFGERNLAGKWQAFCGLDAVSVSQCIKKE